MKSLMSFIVGLVFALGLGISGMTQTHIVRGFLDVLGEWNLALIGVMAGAIMIHSTLYFLIKKRSTPLLDTKFHIPTRKDIDWRLLTGSAIFGLGWGWAGICPGPGIVAAVSGDINVLTYLAALLVGMGFFKLVEKKLP
jgi:uncharacterized membrane protein YedE/YeeE